MHILYASCVALEGSAVLLRGPSGAGKSDLALRLLAQGGELVSDDQTLITAQHGRLFASAPARLHGLIEIRGLGPVAAAPLGLAVATAPMPLALVADLVPLANVPRLPEPAFEHWAGLAVPRLAMDAFSAAAPLKLRLALRLAAAGQLFQPAEIRAAHQADVA